MRLARRANWARSRKAACDWGLSMASDELRVIVSPSSYPFGRTGMARRSLVFLILLGPVANMHATDPKCRCSANRVRNGWCDPCEVGYVASVKIESAALFHAIDAHGHETRPDSLRCETCRIAIESDGFCKKCRTGYIGKKAYFSKLTYLLAQGKVQKPAAVACDKCQGHIQHPGWCDTCHVGMVGHIALTDRGTFSQAVKAYNVLMKAIQYLEKCQDCAIAMAIDRKCYRCKTSYEGGKLVQQQDAKD